MLFWLFVTILLAAGGVAVVLGFRYYQTGDLGINLPGWFAPRPEPRLGVSEQVMVDSRRKLVLIRRDDVEHLIMTGGPVDVVIETGIAGHVVEPRLAAEPPDDVHEQRSPPVFTRPPRALGQAVNE